MKIWNSLLMVSFIFLAASVFAGEPIVFSPDGKLIAVGKSNGAIELVEAKTGKLRKVVTQVDPPPHPASSLVWRPNLAFSPDGAVLASASGSSEVTLWDAKNGEELKKLPSSAVGYDLTFSNTGTFLVGIGADSKIGPQRLTLWNVDTGEAVNELTVETEGFAGGTPLIGEVRFAGSDEVVVFETIEDDQQIVNVWNSSTGKELLRTAVSSWSISADGKNLVTRQADNDRHFIWDTASGTMVRELPLKN